MSEEYFYIEEVPQKTHSGEAYQIELASSKTIGALKRTNPDAPEENTRGKLPKANQDVRLKDIEQQLEMAESRCNSLKGQLDYMKMLYRGVQKEDSGKKPVKPGNRKPSLSNRKLAIDSIRKSFSAVKKDEKGSKTKGLNVSAEYSNPQIDSSLSTVPHHEHEIFNEDAGEAVRTINNILSGISNSVNRLSQLHSDKFDVETQEGFPAPMGVEIVNFSPKVAKNAVEPEKPYQNDNINEVPKTARAKKPTSRDKKLSKSRQTRRRFDVQTDTKPIVVSTSLSNLKRRPRPLTKSLDRQVKVTMPKTADRPRSQTQKLKKSKFTRTSEVCNRERLIEIYHNNAAGSASTSEESIKGPVSAQAAVAAALAATSGPQRKSATGTVAREVKVITSKKTATPAKPAAAIPVEPVKSFQTPRSLSPIAENSFPEPVSSTEKDSCLTKSYELPTIASKMKQVARNYFEQFSFRTIPFVPARSTTPSHNLGLNIQQMMGLIKSRQSSISKQGSPGCNDLMAGISQTLAHNIELAATKLGSRPLSALVSSLGSRMQHDRSACPLMQRQGLLNYPQLQEMAKNAPDQPFGLDDLTDDADKKSNFGAYGVNGGAGDVRQDVARVWTIDPAKQCEQCTCMPRQSVPFHDIVGRFAGDCRSQTQTKQSVTSRSAHCRCASRSLSRRKPFSRPSLVRRSRKSSLQLACKPLPLDGKEKLLKDVLKNLHDEFEKMNDRYEELEAKVNEANAIGEPDEEATKELNHLETILQAKENEINMVIALYNEVGALKSQVRTLRDRASQLTVYQSKRDLNTSTYLTNLLRQIQHFQVALKY